MDSVPPTVVEDGGTRGPASRPRAAVRSFPSPRVRLFGRRARGPRRLGRVARVRRRRLGARERAPSPRRRVSHAGGGRGGLGARARGRRSPLASRSTGRLRTARFPLPHRAARPPRRRRPRRRRARSPLDRRDRGCGAPRRARQKPARDCGGARRRRSHHARVARRHRANPRRARRRRPSLRRRRRTRSPPAASTRLAPPPRTPAGMRAFLLGEDSFEDVGRANRYPELAGVRSTVPPFPSTTARKRRASRGETRPGVYEPSATSTSARAVAMSEVDASVALARVVAEALLRPTNTLNGYDLSGWPDQTSTPVVERDEESATATTMAAESAAVDALAAAAGNLARSIATRLRVALDARATRTRAEARRIGSNGTSAAPVVTPCVATLAARAAVAGGEATFSSLVEYRRRGALERGRLAARAATATASARVKTEVHAVDAAVDAGRTSDRISERHSTAWPSRARVVPASSRARRVRRLESINGGGGGGCGAVGGDGISAREHPRVRVATRISERHSTAWPSRARVVPASSRARRVRRLESINGGGGDGDHVRARRGEWFSTRRRAARLASRAISRRGDPARRRKRSTVRAPRAATDGGDATPGYGSGYRSGYGPGYGLERDGGRGTDVRASEAHVAGDARGGGEETRGNRGGRGGGETREARLGRRARGWSGEARTCSACR